ncbi:unnamed protein product [Dracunculus medinensis]|uniref:MFS domain-containing protein n=1 Tax=Dracunculus medinensis TaxID=318479 RepID=A0A0N4U8D4_DRAME|nr:unnamed protein product [Dracunculus medinensis]
MIGYGFGHFYNDLCASMWFTYFMIFLEKVLLFRSSFAGALMLIGQVADAISTPIVGIASDKSFIPFFMLRLGRRISWHIIGTICVTLSFPFIYNRCLLCDVISLDWLHFAWYVPFVIIFQFGWASVQVSHLALIPELSDNISCRTTMNSLRYGFTVLANLSVFIILAVLLNTVDTGSGIEPIDLTYFSITSFIVVSVGIVSSVIFYITTKESPRSRNYARTNSFSSDISEIIRMSWKNWFKQFQFYQIGALYMLSRLFINISLVYFPFYVTVTQQLTKKFVAILPMISYLSSFVTSVIISIPFINRHINRKALYFFGCLIGITNCILMYFHSYRISIFIIAIALGLAQAILLVTSLAITAELINKNTESGAFVYGAMSFGDKLTNGIALQVIELFNPQCSGPEACSKFYKNIMIFVPGTCIIFAIIVLLTLLPQTVGSRHRRRDDVDSEQADLIINNSMTD